MPRIRISKYRSGETMGARWLAGILASTSFAQLRAAVEANVAHFGFRYFIYHGCFPHT